VKRDASNAKEQPVEVKGKVRAVGKRLAFEVYIPYLLGGGAFNAVEHGRYSVQVKETRNIYVASDTSRVSATLASELGAGLRTWRAIFEEKGYIPAGIGTGAEWDDYSDSGGYAHLISAASQWIIYLDRKRDWELHNVPRVLPMD
jgi:hypothetical protein